MAGSRQYGLRQYAVEGPDVDFLNATEVAAYLSINRQGLYRLIRQGRFPRPELIAGKPRWTGADLASYLKHANRWYPGPFKEPSEEDGDEKKQARRKKTSGDEVSP